MRSNYKQRNRDEKVLQLYFYTSNDFIVFGVKKEELVFIYLYFIELLVASKDNL